MFKSLYKKCLDLAAHKSSKYYLAIVSFIESSFFPIPPDVMVIPMSDVTTNNETVGNYKLEKDKGSNHCYNICFPVGLARFVT